jgi:hypothetical protein
MAYHVPNMKLSDMFYVAHIFLDVFYPCKTSCLGFLVLKSRTESLNEVIWLRIMTDQWIQVVIITYWLSDKLDLNYKLLSLAISHRLIVLHNLAIHVKLLDNIPNATGFLILD